MPDAVIAPATDAHDAATAQRAEALFESDYRTILCRTDRLFALRFLDRSPTTFGRPGWPRCAEPARRRAGRA